MDERKEVLEEGERKVVGLITMKPPEIHHGYQDHRARNRDFLRLVNRRQEMPLLIAQRIETWDAALAQANNSNLHQRVPGELDLASVRLHNLIPVLHDCRIGMRL